MKQTFLLLATTILLFTACGKDDATSTACVKKDLTTTLAGTWKLSNNNAVLTFKADKTYTDASKALHSCAAGTWSAISTDTKIELVCDVTKFKEVRLNSFTCDTIKLQLAGIGAVNMVRQ